MNSELSAGVLEHPVLNGKPTVLFSSSGPLAGQCLGLLARPNNGHGCVDSRQLGTGAFLGVKDLVQAEPGLT